MDMIGVPVASKIAVHTKPQLQGTPLFEHALLHMDVHTYDTYSTRYPR